MTIFSEKDLLETNPAYGYQPTIEPPKEIPVLDTIKSAFELGNSIGSFISADVPTMRLNMDYDSFANIQGYEEHAELFINDDSPEDTVRTKANIDLQKQNQQILQESGALGAASLLAAGVLDPVNLIPVGGQAYKTYSLGGSILRGAMNVGKAGLVSSAAQEAILQSTQSLRTAEEGAINIGASTLLSGFLGGSIASVSAGVVSKFAKDMEIPHPDVPDIMTESNSVLIKTEDLMKDTAGAMRVPETTMAEETLKGAFGLEKGAQFLSPNLHLANSPSLESRKLAQRLAETPYYYEKNDLGIASPIAVETRIKMDRSLEYRALTSLEQNYASYRKRIKEAGEKPLTKDAFAERVGVAMRNGDMDEIAEIANSAKAYRKELFDPLKQQAIEAGLLDKDVSVSTSESYFMRSYDKRKIVANMADFKERLVNGLKQESADLNKQVDNYYGSKIKKLQNEIKQVGKQDLEKTAALKSEIENLKIEASNKKLIISSDADMRLIADEVTNHILGLPEGVTTYRPIPVTRGPLKERVLNFVKDNDIADYLHSDVRHVGNSYLRTMSPDVHLTKEFGDTTLKAEMEKITSEYTSKIEATSDGAEALKLEKRMKQDLSKLEDLIKLLRHQYGMPKDPDSWFVRGGRIIRQGNFLSKLGGMTVSAIPDLARAVMTTGITNVVKHGLVPLIKNFKKYRIEAQEARITSGAIETVLSNRASVMSEINNIFIPNTKFEKGLNALSNNFGNLTLMNQWNTALKGFSGICAQARIINGAKEIADGKIKTKDIKYLSQLGISAGDAKRIAKMFDEHGLIEDGLFIAKLDKWTDSRAKTVFSAALSKEIDRTIVTPGVGDRPLWMSTEMGKIFGQFKSFTFASTQRVLISGLQQDKAMFVNNLIISSSLGAFVYYLKTPSERLSDNPADWVKEGIDRSGMLGILTDVNALLEKSTRGAIGASALTGRPPLTRFANTNALGMLAGPTMGTLSDLFTITGAAASGDWTKQDVRAVRRLIPYQNLLGVKQIFDEIETNINESIGQ